jgi:hypothetical protein
MKDGFYSFNQYLRSIFKERVHRISIDAGFSCPNRDGRLSDKGCIYCNNKGFGVFVGEDKSIEEQIKTSIEFYEKKLKVKKFIAYFQSFTNTYAGLEELERRYSIIKEFPQIVGLFISTRPDCIDKEKLKLISSYKKDYLVWIEYGLQTTHNHLLKEMNRNHTYEDFLSALELTKKFEINVGVHIILGLPSATYEDMIEDARKISQLALSGIKFHVLHILRDTPLEELYQKKKVNLLQEKDYIKIICDFLEIVPPDLVVLRLVSSAHPSYLVAPLWINKRNEIIEKIRKELENRNTYQGYFYEGSVN